MADSQSHEGSIRKEDHPSGWLNQGLLWISIWKCLGFLALKRNFGGYLEDHPC